MNKDGIQIGLKFLIMKDIMLERHMIDFSKKNTTK